MHTSQTFWGWDALHQYGAIGEDEFGLTWDERTWLGKACDLLGIDYTDLGEGYRPGRRAVEVSIPRGWSFESVA